ncbi:MAG: 4a-hydroxytetrahydrobiopterin dehydratase [Myxococcales bacterium]|nr:4a-hydroxytetrahydrobiopterin dehydratase [Myxococcales bacterium]
MTRPRKLEAQQVETRLSELSAWALVDGKLHRELLFEDFAAAFAFMTAMALVSESLAHHPEWFNVYNRVTIDLTTHDAGGITELDFEWARAAERHLAERTA